MTNDILESLEEWFAQNCDGDCEHGKTIKIAAIDNPGWGVTVNLLETELEDKPFVTIDVENSPEDWVYCVVKNHEFQGHGGVRNLTQILKIFLDWAKMARRDLFRRKRHRDLIYRA